VRFWNVKHPAAYAQRLSAGESPGAGREVPDAEARTLENVLLRTRIREGLPVSEILGEGRRAVAALIADGLVDGPSALHGRIVLTLRGRLLADAVVRALTE
jgi:oxygen-independent coproporphyrinogen-3 oxidase